MSPNTEKDCKFCPEHSVTDNRLTAVEEKQTVVETNTAIVNKLTGRVGLLIAIMSLGTVAVTGGAIYTFTAIAQFKSEYSEHRIALIDKMNKSQNETVARLSGRMEGMERRIDGRMDDLSNRMATMEATIKRDR